MKTKYFFSISILVIAMLLNHSFALAQESKNLWAKLYEEQLSDVLHSLITLPNGDIVIGGWTNAEQSQGENILLMRLDPNGNIIWQYSIGKNELDYVQIINLTQDNNIIVGGHTRSFGAGSYDIVLMKVDLDGKILWQKTYGTYDDNAIANVLPLEDGGFLVGGWSYLGSGRAHDALIFKTDADGNLLWQKHYGTKNYEVVKDLIEANDGNYILLGVLYSDETQFDIWVVKLDPNGEIIWQKSFGGNGNENPVKIINSDGSYLIFGTSDSFSTDGKDIFILSINENGEVNWAKTYPDQMETNLISATTYDKDRYLAVGSSGPKSGQNNDLLIAIFNSNGDFLKGKLFGGDNNELGYSIVEYENNLILAGGYSYSFSSNGNSDILLLLTDENLTLPPGDVKVNDFNLSGSPTSINFEEVTTVASEDTTSLVVTDTDFDVSDPHLVMRNLNVVSSVEVPKEQNQIEFLNIEGDKLLVRFKALLSSPVQVRISNLLGQEVYTTTIEPYEKQIVLQFSSLPQGFYLVSFDGASLCIPVIKH